MDPDEVIAKALEVGKGIFAFLHGLITSIVEFLIEHPEVLVFAGGFFIGYKVGMFFGKDQAEEDVFSFLTGGMKLD